ncbi:MAG: pyridoxamine 5'-phosphate oxidase family protein [Planctomycetota bacterium]
MEWIDQFDDDTVGIRPLVAQVATCADGGLPRCRSIVFRGWDEPGVGRMVFVSDRRSEKNATLRHNSGMEACFWLESARVQWRIGGTVEVCGEAAREDLRGRVWRELSDTARALFFWPASGEPKADDQAFPETVDADTPIPDTFEVLVLTPSEVDRLDLNPHPHKRTHWPHAEGDGSAVNP